MKQSNIEKLGNYLTLLLLLLYAISGVVDIQQQLNNFNNSYGRTSNPR